MILSRTTQYAIQALIFMATQPPGVAVLNRTIAECLKSPPTYLAKILQELCRGNLLYSFRGKQGGFCLRERSDKINLMQIVRITEGPAFTEDCVLGLKTCSDTTACPMRYSTSPRLSTCLRLTTRSSRDASPVFSHRDMHKW